MEPVEKTRWLVSCDESGVHGAEYYGFGTLWMKWQRRGDFAAAFRDLQVKHDYFLECKWQKAGNRHAESFLDELITYFFEREWLAFHCLVVRKGMVNKACHNGDYDLARRKHFGMLITNKIKQATKKNPSRRESVFRIWVDPIHSEYAKADEELKAVGNNVLGRDIHPSIESVVTKDSKVTPQIQLCDLLLGAVMAAWQGDCTSGRKLKVQKLI